jgi:hypothetical protein
MKLVLFFLILGPAFAEDFRSPIRKICEHPAGPVLSDIRTVGDLRSTCSNLTENTSPEVSSLAKNVLAVVETVAADPKDKLRNHKELLTEVGKLTDAVSAATISQAESPREQLAGDIKTLISQYSTVKSRRENSMEYYTNIKNIIAQTPQGKRVIDCFEHNPDKRIKDFKLKFIGSGERNPGNDQAAYLDYNPIPDDPLKRTEFVMNIDVRTNPVAAISMVAHEMQHACLGSTICDHINECSDTDESECTQFNEAIFVDELTAHHFEAQIFADLAKSAPGIMCSYTYVDGVNGPQRLADLHAMNEEAYENGNLLSLLNGRYTGAGLWPRGSVYDPIAVNPGPRESIKERIKKLGIPPQN